MLNLKWHIFGLWNVHSERKGEGEKKKKSDTLSSYFIFLNITDRNVGRFMVVFYLRTSALYSLFFPSPFLKVSRLPVQKCKRARSLQVIRTFVHPHGLVSVNVLTLRQSWRIPSNVGLRLASGWRRGGLCLYYNSPERVNVSVLYFSIIIVSIIIVFYFPSFSFLWWWKGFDGSEVTCDSRVEVEEVKGNETNLAFAGISFWTPQSLSHAGYKWTKTQKKTKKKGLFHLLLFFFSSSFFYLFSDQPWCSNVIITEFIFISLDHTVVELKLNMWL